MANLLSRFNEASVNTGFTLVDYISTIGVSGDFKKINDIEVLLNSWSNILITPKRSYQYDPEYGSDLYKLVFEPADETTLERIKDEVSTNLMLYDDRAGINDIAVTYFDDQKGFALSIDVEFNGNTKRLDVILDENTYFKFFEAADDK